MTKETKPAKIPPISPFCTLKHLRTDLPVDLCFGKDILNFMANTALRFNQYFYVENEKTWYCFDVENGLCFSVEAEIDDFKQKYYDFLDLVDLYGGQPLGTLPEPWKSSLLAQQCSTNELLEEGIRLQQQPESKVNNKHEANYFG